MKVWSQIILPKADAGCGKVFHKDRESAQGHRVAMEFWYQATGRGREGCRLAVFRCKRCGGFHIGWKRKAEALPLLHPDSHEEGVGFDEDFLEEEALDDVDQLEQPAMPPILDSASVHCAAESPVHPGNPGGLLR